MDTLFEHFKFAFFTISIILPPVMFCFTLGGITAFFAYRIEQRNFLRAFGFFLTTSTFGLTIGMFMGASEAPIVSSVLPPIITLVSGYLTYQSGKLLNEDLKPLIPGGIFTLLLNILFSAFYMKTFSVGLYE